MTPVKTKHRTPQGQGAVLEAAWGQPRRQGVIPYPGIVEKIVEEAPALLLGIMKDDKLQALHAYRAAIAEAARLIECHPDLPGIPEARKVSEPILTAFLNSRGIRRVPTSMLPTEIAKSRRSIEAEVQRKHRAKMTEEERVEWRARETENQRQRRANAKLEKKANKL